MMYVCLLCLSTVCPSMSSSVCVVFLFECSLFVWVCVSLCVCVRVLYGSIVMSLTPPVHILRVETSAHVEVVQVIFLMHGSHSYCALIALWKCLPFYSRNFFLFWLEHVFMKQLIEVCSIGLDVLTVSCVSLTRLKTKNLVHISKLPTSVIWPIIFMTFRKNLIVKIVERILMTK